MTRLRRARPDLAAVGESSVILLNPPLPLVGASIGIIRGCQQNDSLANGQPDHLCEQRSAFGPPTGGREHAVQPLQISPAAAAAAASFCSGGGVEQPAAEEKSLGGARPPQDGPLQGDHRRRCCRSAAARPRPWLATVVRSRPHDHNYTDFGPQEIVDNFKFYS